MPSSYLNNMETQFNFLQVKEGKTYFARVVVALDTRVDGVKIAEKAGAQIPSFNTDWLEAARLGAERALRTHVDLGGSRVGLEVITVLGTEVDTRRDTVEVAAFCAAWKAFGHDESALKIDMIASQWRVCPREAT
jgi:hypothetical protein